jgi:pimeloyl-ACP methyl ester carboxylesterase
MHHYLKRVVHSHARVVSQWVIGSALVMGAGVGQAYGQAATFDSTLTSTRTAQVLLLNTNVSQLPNGQYRWTFRLTNPVGNTSRIRFFTAAPNCDLTQITNIVSPPGWVFQVFRSQSEAPDAPKINWFVAPGQPGPLAFNSPWLNPVPGQNVKLFSFDLPFGANNQNGRAGALNTFGWSGATLGCQIGNLTITGACPDPNQPSLFRVTFRVQFQNRGDVTISVTRAGQTLSRTLTGLTSGNYSADFNIGALSTVDEIIQINGVAVENGVTFTASATSRITAPVVIVPGVRPTDTQDGELASGDPKGLVNFLTGQLPATSFVCPPIIKVAPFCPPADPIEQAADMVEQIVRQTQAQSGGAKVHLIGHGGGAILARYYLAARDRSASTVRTLSLVSPPNQGMLRAILSPNRDAFNRYWPAYPFWRESPGTGLYMTPRNMILEQDLGFFAPPVPTLVIYGTGTETPAIGVGSAKNPYYVENASGDGTVTESSARALAGAQFVAIPGLRFTNGLSNPAVGQAIAPFILAH